MDALVQQQQEEEAHQQPVLVPPKTIAADVAVDDDACFSHNLGPRATIVDIPGLSKHLKCYATPSAGRTVITTKRIQKGETAFAQMPYAHTIHFRHKTTTCDGCFLFSHGGDNTLPYPCVCGVHYCSEACQTAFSTRHCCDLIRQVQQQGKASGKNKSMHTALSLLISITSNRTDRPMDDVLLMMQDSSKVGIKKSIDAEQQFRRLSTKQQQQQPKKGHYAQALTTVKLNALGMYDASGDEVGYALSPAMAMVNHSCLPNCQQQTTNGVCQLIALYDVPAGTELSYSYVSLLSSSSNERKQALRKNWEFTCTCVRCRNLVDCRVFDEEHTCYCGAVCLEVDRSVGSCVCNPPMI